MTTPLLSTYVRGQNERRERQMQTAFPAKVLEWTSSDNTVRLEPQFIETWVTSDSVTHYEDADNTYIDNVPVCYPWHMTWDITVGAFGLVICTKYSLDLWRQQLRRMDPGDLRRFTMSGATFHPVVIGESPTGTTDFAARADRTDAEIDRIWTVLTTWTPGVADSGAALKLAAIDERVGPPDAPPDTACDKVKVE
jgi:hypothetical protein